MEQVTLEETARLKRIAEANAAYFGQYPDPLKTRPGQANDNTKPNLARLIVDKGKSFLMGEAGPKFTVDGAANDWLDKCLKHNKWPTRSKEIALNGALTGHAFIKLVPAQNNEPYPRIVVLDPATVTATWNPDDIADIWRYRIQYPAVDVNGKPMVKKQVVERDDAGRWTIFDSESHGNGPWIEMNRTDWPFAWSPVLSCQNIIAPNVFYGFSDVEPDIMHLIYRIHFILSNAARINRIDAHPRTWGKGFKKSELNIAPDEMLILPTPDAALGVVEAHGDIAGSLSLYQSLRDLLMELARIPPITLAKMESIGNLAGIALKILYAPIREVTADKRGTYGDMFNEMGANLLELGRQAQSRPDVSCAWPDMVPQNETEAQQAIQSDLAAGLISKETASTKRGYDWSKEDAKIKAEAPPPVEPAGSVNAANDAITQLTRR